MLKLDKNKLAGLKTFDDHLQERYGDENSPERKEFEAKAKAWYYAELLKDERKRQNVTQKVLAEKSVRNVNISRHLKRDRRICSSLRSCVLPMLLVYAFLWYWDRLPF